MARLVFFGTPDFAVPSLLALEQFCQREGHTIEWVVTQNDKPQGRKQEIQFTAVKKAAVDLGLKVLQPQSLRKNTEEGQSFYDILRKHPIDLAIVVAYGKIIPQRILDIPHRGFLNIHGSLLPAFRGAAPIQRAIMDGLYETGIGLMQMVLALDEGPVFAEAKTPIISSDTSGSLSYRLAHLGANLLVQKLPDILMGAIKAHPQEGPSTYARMLDKEEAIISWQEPGQILNRKVHGLDPWPGSFVVIDKKRVKLFDSFFVPVHPQNKSPISEKIVGTIVCMKQFLGIRVSNGVIYFPCVQVEGRKKLPAEQGLQGLGIKVGDQISF